MNNGDEVLKSILQNHNYQMKDLIGSGSFASVYTVYSLKYQQIFCAKIIHANDTHNIASYNSELRVLLDLDHPNIIRLYDAFEEKSFLFLIFEYCRFGSVKDSIIKNGPFSFSQLINCCKQILEAIKTCHQSGIIHRDIKPDNIFISDHNIYKLADFGLGRHVLNGCKISQNCGSLPFLAPEIIKKSFYDPIKADIWSAGVTFYYLSTGYLPWVFQDKVSLIKAIESASIEFPSSIPLAFKEFLQYMLNKDPSKRQTAEQLLHHSVLSTSIPCEPVKISKMIRLSDSSFIHYSSSQQRLVYPNNGNLQLGKTRKTLGSTALLQILPNQKKQCSSLKAQNFGSFI